MEKIIGKKTLREINEDDVIYYDDIEGIKDSNS